MEKRQLGKFMQIWAEKAFSSREKRYDISVEISILIKKKGGERYGRHFLYGNRLQPLLWDGSFQAENEGNLVHEPDNKYDKEAIRVEARALGKIGYVANSPYTVLGESRSSGRLYDLIDDGATGRVLYVLPQGLVYELEETGFEKVKKIYKKHRNY